MIIFMTNEKENMKINWNLLQITLATMTQFNYQDIKQDDWKEWFRLELLRNNWGNLLYYETNWEIRKCRSYNSSSGPWVQWGTRSTINYKQECLQISYELDDVVIATINEYSNDLSILMPNISLNSAMTFRFVR